MHCLLQSLLCKAEQIVRSYLESVHIALQEEREERQLRKAEMEMTKAENLVEHGAEIFAKPARTWFQTERQKQEAAKAAKDASDKGNAQRPKKEKEAEKNALKRKRGLETDSESRKKKSKLMQVSWLLALTSFVKEERGPSILISLSSRPLGAIWYNGLAHSCIGIIAPALGNSSDYK